jgi:hypothetical protein
MGGKLFPITRRYSKEEYEKVYPKIQKEIENMLNTETFHVFTFTNKESFGDLDILVLNNGNLGDVRKKIEETFKTDMIHSNGNVHSFAYVDFQVDMILTPTNNWETAKTFFPNDPTGNLMGKLSHKFGLKYGFQGLVYPFRNFDGRLTEDIVISKDNAKIFEFLGLSYDRYLETFDTVEEIFDYIIGSKYFNGDNYLMGNLNHVDRKRNKKRETYQGFLTYINENKPINNFEFSKNKEDYHQMINDYFPEAKILKKLEKLKKTDEENKIIKEKFNGRLVMDWYPHLQGKTLGNILGWYKSFLGDAYRRFMLNSTEDEVKNHFTIWMRDYK